MGKQIGPIIYDEVSIMDEEDWERLKEYLKSRPPHNFPVIMTDIHKWEWVEFSHPSPDKD